MRLRGAPDLAHRMTIAVACVPFDALGMIVSHFCGSIGEFHDPVVVLFKRSDRAYPHGRAVAEPVVGSRDDFIDPVLEAIAVARAILLTVFAILRGKIPALVH